LQNPGCRKLQVVIWSSCPNVVHEMPSCRSSKSAKLQILFTHYVCHMFTSTIDQTVEDSDSMTSFRTYCSIIGQKSTSFGCV
jgi:hypothetical protein